MIFIGLLLIVALAYLVIGQIKNAEIILSPLIGVMFGFLYFIEDFFRYRKKRLDNDYFTIINIFN